MTKGYFTQAELINMKVLTTGLALTSNRIKDLIDTHLKSDARKQMKLGLDYYNGKHDILNFTPYYWLDGQQVQDVAKSNHKLPHLFHKVLVDQKVGYTVGNPIVIGTAEDDNESNESEKDTEESLLMDLLGDSFDDVMNDWVLYASNQGVGWLHFFIDAEGELNFIIIDGQELIPIYDTKYQKNLVGMIRYFEVEEVIESGNKVKLESHKRYRVEWWTSKDVTYYAQTDTGEFILDTEYAVNPSGHFMSYNTQDPDSIIQGSWEAVPFIGLDNNSLRQTDLQPIKPLIDAYDKVKSGWVNDLSDLQELIYVLKGYSALTNQAQKGLSELAVFLQNLKTNKVISVDEDGGVDTLKAEIPVEAKEKFLSITRQEIFYFGQGVDTSNEKFGNAPSGISLKFLYSLLDMKVNTLMRKMTKQLGVFMLFVAKYAELSGKGKIDPTQYVYTFNKAVIFNEKEKVDMLVASGEVRISRQTLLENHPLVEDAVEEQARLDAEEEADIAKGLTALDKLPVDPNAPIKDPTIDPNKPVVE